ncbi:hypothetical protein [Agathobaculum desmolans]|uniref:hypothetical protein n=1 Tax=Agathobaculum desmolans TaxID=39484 RepID=UPI00248E59E2|nr:hypothetical protein [Agathobaculum desmolans]
MKRKEKVHPDEESALKQDDVSSSCTGEEVPDGIALPPHERHCGRSHPMRGTNSEDLTEWCIRHQT